MSAQERTAADACYVLKAVARLLRASPYQTEDPAWAEQHAAYLDDIAAAVARDAALDPVKLEAGARQVGSEWEASLMPILFGEDQADAVARRLQSL